MGRNGGSGGSKIVVPIPVHVNRFAVRSQHQQMEKMCLSGPKPDLRKKIANDASGFEQFNGAAVNVGVANNSAVLMAAAAAANLSAASVNNSLALAAARSIY